VHISSDRKYNVIRETSACIIITNIETAIQNHEREENYIASTHEPTTS